MQALLTSRTRAEAARAAGIGESTLREYMKDPEFLERYRDAFSKMVEDATRQAQQVLSPALSVLHEIMEDGDIPAAARISAARAALEFGIKLTETNDFAARLEALERAQE